MPRHNSSPELAVSVIIPTYNRAGYLRQALDSVLAQTIRPAEIIVVDDGSTDDTAACIAAYGPAVRYLCHQGNRGIAAARNTGLQAAQGDLIAWLDSDDLWEPAFLARTTALLAEDATLDGAYTGLTMIDAEGTALRTAIHVEPPAELYDAMVRDSFLATASLVVRRRCYDQVGLFDPQFRICEDYDMWLRLAQRFRMAGIPEPLVRIRVHGSNTMADLQAVCAARLAVAEKHFPASQADGSAARASRRACGYALRSVALRHLEAGQPEEGWRLFQQAVERYPAMLGRLDTCYELACADQPRGWRGDAASLDLVAGGDDLLLRLEALLDHAPAEIRAWRWTALGNAHLALGMLSDQAGDWTLARQHLWRALRANPRLALERGVVRRLAKLHVGRRLVAHLRRLQPARSEEG